MDYETTPSTHIERLIAFYAHELHIEVVINRDSTGFWKTADEDIFSHRLSSFRVGLKSFTDRIASEGDMFNYFSALCFRIYSQPFTETAVKVFCEGFDQISSDKLLKDGFDWKTTELSSVGQLLLFMTVHRNEIYIAMQKRELAEAAATKTPVRR